VSASCSNLLLSLVVANKCFDITVGVDKLSEELLGLSTMEVFSPDSSMELVVVDIDFRFDSDLRFAVVFSSEVCVDSCTSEIWGGDVECWLDLPFFLCWFVFSRSGGGDLGTISLMHQCVPGKCKLVVGKSHGGGAVSVVVVHFDRCLDSGILSCFLLLGPVGVNVDILLWGRFEVNVSELEGRWSAWISSLINTEDAVCLSEDGVVEGQR